LFGALTDAACGTLAAVSTAEPSRCYDDPLSGTTRLGSQTERVQIFREHLRVVEYQ
jgi:hypothetical protein